jgi:hypothetical protein
MRRALLQPIRAKNGDVHIARPARGLLLPLLGALLGALLVLLAYQIPARHQVDIGGFDGAYVRGFHDVERSDLPTPPAYLSGSDGHARWTRAESYLLFPQIGQPAELRLRVRGWEGDAGRLPELVLRNNRAELARLRYGPEWQDLVVPIRGELLKPNDILIVLSSDTTRLPDGREVGVLVDRAELATVGWPILPYPAQLLYGAFAVGLYALWRGHSARIVAAAALLGLAFLLLYRLQPLYPYPLRGLLPLSCALLAGLCALRLARLPRARELARPRLADLLACGAIGAWALALSWPARAHVTLSVPGVEKDFRVFATRTGSLGEVFKADGFYNLGYPLLLYLAQPLSEGSAFLAARLLALAFGALFLGAGYLLARRLLGAWWGLAALAMLALSGFVVQYALTIGSDMPFAALVALSLALLAAAAGPSPLALAAPLQERKLPLLSRSGALLLAAGAAGGAAFLVRHPGILLLPFGLLAVWLVPQATPLARRAGLIGFGLGFLLVAAPQLAVNTAQTGNPLYSQQAKNIWLGVYGNTDWGRWEEAPNTIGLAEVLLQDPARVLANWTGNLRAFAGTGAEDTSEFGRAVQLRLLGFPANWLAVAGLLAFAWRGRRFERLLLGWIALYVAAIAVSFLLPRFVLPLAPIYALAAAACLKTIAARLWHAHTLVPAALGLAGLLLLAALQPGLRSGAGQVLDQQPAAEVAAVALVQRSLAPGERLLAELPPEVPLAKYSAIAHLVVDDPAEAAFLLSAEAAPPAGLSATPAGRAGPYQLYRIAP